MNANGVSLTGTESLQGGGGAPSALEGVELLFTEALLLQQPDGGDKERHC